MATRSARSGEGLCVLLPRSLHRATMVIVSMGWAVAKPATRGSLTTMTYRIELTYCVP